MKQFLLLMLFIVCCVTVLKLYNGHGARKITAAGARLDSGDPVVLLDVRTAEEFAEGHIPGAVCLPVEAIGRTAPAELPDKSAEILVYCRSGSRSAKAARKLTGLGYTHVADFGGIQDWPYETTTD